MRDIAASFEWGFTRAKLGEFDAGDFLAGTEIHDGKAIEIGQLNEHPFCGTVCIRLERNGTHTQIERQYPRGLLRLNIDYGEGFTGDRTGNYKLSVGRDIG